MNEQKLERCPFCGESPRMKEDENSCGELFYQVRHDCKHLLSMIETFCYKTETEAAEAWNRRAPLPDNKALTVELPSEPIAARYDVADMLEDFKKEAEFSDHSVGINGITWAESALLAAIIDGLNVGRPPEKGN